jgi:hypothetical protein
MLATSVSLLYRCGSIFAPQYAFPGRGSDSGYGQWGPSSPAPRTPLGAAFSVSRRPRDRMGLRGIARTHARYQRQRNVHRSARPSLGRRRLCRATESSPDREARLLCKAHRTRPRHGCDGGASRIGKSEALSGSSFVTHSTRHLRPPYTREYLCGGGVACGKE